MSSHYHREGATEIVEEKHRQVRDGTCTLSRLAEVFGRGKEEDFRGPEFFCWGPGSTYSRWQQYKIVADGTDWVDKFPGTDLLPISQAKQGFTKYYDQKWVLHGVREKVNYESCTWKEFRDAFGNYLGEAFSAENVRLRLLGRRPDPMGVSGILYNKPEDRCFKLHRWVKLFDERYPKETQRGRQK